MSREEKINILTDFIIKIEFINDNTMAQFRTIKQATNNLSKYNYKFLSVDKLTDYVRNSRYLNTRSFDQLKEMSELLNYTLNEAVDNKAVADMLIANCRLVPKDKQHDIVNFIKSILYDQC